MNNSVVRTIRDTETTNIIEEKIKTSNGETKIKKYLKGRFLGKGGFAKCYELTDLETKKMWAVKVVSKDSLNKGRAKQKLMSEIRIHKSLLHHNVVAFQHFFEDSTNVYIVLELCANQTLNELVKRRRKLTELETQCYISQLIGGLRYLHSQKVIHRDLKLGNLFLSEKMELKLADFGLAAKVEFEGERKRTICGTPNYIAPEILEGRRGHSYEVDIWSLGVVLYTMIIGRPPFETKDVKATYKRIRMNSYSFPEGCGISSHARNLIQRVLTSEPSKRPTLAEIAAHPFFSSNSIPKLLPVSSLACPPSASFIKQFMGKTYETSTHRTSTLSKLENTVPLAEATHTATKEVVHLITERALTLRPPGKAATNFLGSTKVIQTGCPIEKPQLTQRPATKPITVPTSARLEMKPTKSKLKPADVWITKWVDYSSKYGLGYLLSNSTCGIFFNDSTKILLESNGCDFQYLERKSKERVDVSTAYKLTEYPKELQKKVTLLQYFRSYLEGENSIKATAPLPNTQVYVKKWLRTKQAILFRLSNKVVQVNFTDDTEIILSSESKVVTYVNYKGERAHCSLENAMYSKNQEMAKRLKITREIITRMLNQNKK